MDDLFKKPERRNNVDLNLVPIIDMLTSVIFFVLLSTTFMAYTKLTVPPSKVSTITDPVAPPPVAAKVYLLNAGDELRLMLSWAGKEPGSVTETLKRPRRAMTEVEREQESKRLIELSRRVSAKFSGKYPLEKTIQIGLGNNVPYQDLISVMDGLRENMPDVVLISYEEAMALGKSMATEKGDGA